MQALAAEYGVIAIDLPGSGCSPVLPPTVSPTVHRYWRTTGTSAVDTQTQTSRPGVGQGWRPHEIQRRRRRDARVGSHLQVQVPVGAESGLGSTGNVVRPVDDSIARFRGTRLSGQSGVSYSQRGAVGPAVTEHSMRAAAEKCRPQQHDCSVDDCLVSTLPAVLIAREDRCPCSGRRPLRKVSLQWLCASVSSAHIRRPSAVWRRSPLL